jgi:hypothetical protein
MASTGVEQLKASIPWKHDDDLRLGAFGVVMLL